MCLLCLSCCSAYREDLSQLGDIVGRCVNLVFVLTDNVFESAWCMRELQSAIQHGVNVILITKDGARWNDTNGNATCAFPPEHLLRKLPPEVQDVCSRKVRPRGRTGCSMHPPSAGPEGSQGACVHASEVGSHVLRSV
jgi:hypothetical protein